MDLGASIVIDSNKNLLRAANEFNLSLYRFDDEDGDMAIWNGERVSHRVWILATSYLVVLTLSPKGDKFRALGLMAAFSKENASTVSH